MAKNARLSSLAPSRNSSYERWRVQIFLITWITYAGFYFTRQAFSVAKVGILDDPSVNHVLTKEVLGNLDALYLGTYAVGQFMWGAVADRFGPRVVVLGGLAFSALAAIFMGLFPALVLFVPLMLVQGLAQSTGWSSLCKNMASFFSPRERGRILGLWSTNYAFGGLVAAPFAGWWAYSVFDHWNVAFYASAATVLIILVLFFIVQRDRPEGVGFESIETYHGISEEPEESTATTPHFTLRDAFVMAMRNRMVLILGISYFLLKPARYAILLWGPVIVTQRLPGVSNLQAIVIPVSFGIAGLIAPIAIGFVSDKLFNARRVPSAVLSLAALMAALLAFEPLTATRSVVVTVATLAFIGLAIYAADTMLSCTAAVDFGTSQRAGASTGFINGCGSVGAILGGLLPGYLDATTLFYGFAGAALLSGVLLVPWWNQKPATA